MGNHYFRIRCFSSEKRCLRIIVSKKVAKAHKRNLIKRIVRESFRCHPEKFPAGKVIVIARQPLGDLNRKDVWRYLWDALKK